jgi:hypothetical protein
MNEETRRILENHEARLKKLESGGVHKKRSSKKTKGVIDLLIEAKDEGFFATKRTPHEILHNFSTKGYVYKRTQSLTEPLQRATRQGIIKRMKNNGGWVYYV